MISLHRPRLVAAGLASGLVAALVSSTAPAMAESYTQRDAVRDVVTFSFDSETGEESAAEDPTNAATDIRRVRVDFRERKLVVRATLRAATSRIIAVAQVRAAGEDYYVSTSRSRVSVESAHGSADERCRGAVVATRARTVRLAVPASCLGDPASARVGFGIIRYVGRGSSIEGASVDDAGRTGFPENAENLKLGKRVQRG